MPNWRSNGREKGFTLFELVIVLGITGTLAAIALPRFTDSDNSLMAQAYKLASDLRHVQSMAMNQGRTLMFDIQSSNSYQVSFGGNVVLDPATMQSYTVALEDNVTITGADVEFDSMGRPVTAGNLIAAERVYTLGSNTRNALITLSPVTGFVAVLP